MNKDVEPLGNKRDVTGGNVNPPRGEDDLV